VQKLFEGFIDEIDVFFCYRVKQGFVIFPLAELNAMGELKDSRRHLHPRSICRNDLLTLCLANLLSYFEGLLFGGYHHYIQLTHSHEF
jgi:hypothetical protein